MNNKWDQPPKCVKYSTDNTDINNTWKTRYSEWHEMKKKVNNPERTP